MSQIGALTKLYNIVITSFKFSPNEVLSVQYGQSSFAAINGVEDNMTINGTTGNSNVTIAVYNKSWPLVKGTIAVFKASFDSNES